jgi:hypothetical protein
MQLLIAPDTQQNIIYTVYFILIHNFAAILYSIGIVIMAVWALYKPTRWKLLIMWGFIVLLFAFEYKKHIVDALVEQTRNSLITERQSWRLERYVNIILAKLVPLVLPLFGWMLVIGGSAMKFFKIEEKINKKLQ